MYRNLLLVFFLSGLWHGAGFQFLVWGMLHGVLYVATRFRQNKRKKRNDMSVAKGEGEEKSTGVRGIRSKMITIVSQIATFLYVSVAWVYFRAADIAQANTLLLTALKGKAQKVSLDLAECLRPDEFWYVLKVLHLDHFSFSRYILMWGILAAGLYLAMIGKNARERVTRLKYGPVSAAVSVILAVWCILSFSGVSTFLYFNF